ncbi:MAG: endopeptidase La [Gemmatimonadales bacterium]|nr:MAG: endopeptidase La [Gemmatimonadales bacterium]
MWGRDRNRARYRQGRTETAKLAGFPPELCRSGTDSPRTRGGRLRASTPTPGPAHARLTGSHSLRGPMGERFTLPILPLRDTVVYPGVAVPISAGRPGTVEAVQAAIDGDRRLFAVAQRENVDEPTSDLLYTVGTVVRVLQTHRVRGGMQLLVQGEDRAEAVTIEKAGSNMLQASLIPLTRFPPRNPEDPAFQALDKELRDRAAELGTRRGVPAEALNQLISGVGEPGSFADLVAFYLDLPTADKQKLLEVLDDEERMRRALVAVERELARLDAQEEIQARVQEELGERQREMLLREQMKQIQRELGDEDDRKEVEELRKRIEALNLEPDARTEVDRELRRLERTSPQSAEYQVIRTYLEWITELPWSERTDDRIDLGVSQRILDEDHYGLEDVKDRIIEFLAVRKLQMERSPELEPGSGASGTESGGPEGEGPAAPATDRVVPAGEAPNPEPVTGSAGSGSESAAAEGVSPPTATARSGNGSAIGVVLGGSDGAEAGPEPDPEPGPDIDPAIDPESEGDPGPAIDPPVNPDDDLPGPVTDRPKRSVGRGPILLFAGPPGVGKTSIAQSIARSLGRKYVRISLGGARDEADIRGHRRTYVGAMPGRILQGMRQAKTKNPVFLLDEVDKLGVSFQGDPSSALLEVLDPAQNSSFTDHYLGIPFDLSEVLFIATANYVDRIPAPLLDRMERVEFSGYTEAEKLEIASRYLLPRQREEAGLKDEELQLTDDAVRSVITQYTREAGVRQLERELGKVARKVARKVAADEPEALEVGPDEVRELLGRPRVHPEKMRVDDTVGVTTGMFYTPMGGDIMFVEASVAPGDGGLVLTGQLGDVMKESGRAAWTYAKSRREHFGIPLELMKGVEVHIHVPAGAIPKDGPSAGITMATSLVSALSGRKVRRDVAMTGELTLTGRVLPIGGVKEKVLGAVRAGISEVILPADNEVDLEDLPAEVRDSMTFHLVEMLDDVLKYALAEGAADPPRIPRVAGRGVEEVQVN